MTSTRTLRTLYMSDEAYDVLTRRARHADYVGIKALSDYVEDMLTKPHIFTDNRPDDVRAQDRDMLEAGYAPEWRVYGPRRRRSVRLSEQAAVQATAQAAILLMAFPPSKRMIGAPTYMDTNQCVSVLLEAIGSDWIEVRCVETVPS